MKTSLIPFLIFLCIGCSSAQDKAPSGVEDILKKAGVEMQQPQPDYNDEFAVKIIGELLPLSEINKIFGKSARMGKGKSILFDYGERGKSLSFQKALNLYSGSHFDLLIDNERGIKLRHKIIIGTDLVNWEKVKKESTWPEDKPFKRTYLLVHKRGENQRMRGIAFYKGAMATINVTGNVNDDSIKALEQATWGMAKSLEATYESKIKTISEGPLFKNDPVITRPDLPDPDLE